MSKKALRIFVSSTAADLEDYRDKAQEAILKLDNLPVAMEAFKAMPGTPVKECCRLAADADGVVVLVAHRFGYVPSKELDGDGARSITWLEVEAARSAGKGVFAFLIDPNYPWTRDREETRLTREPEKAVEIARAVQQLGEFKKHLQAHFTPAWFTTPDNLAYQVATALAGFAERLQPQALRPAKVWRPRVCYPLQPAPHFQGREHLRGGLLTWARAPVSPDRVVSLVAVGGTGKTALAQRVLHEMGEQSAAGVLVWSFYENPRTEQFLRSACEYFTGDVQASAGGLLERLQTALTGEEPHLLVLDGLERVQAEGTTGRPRGELEDPQMRRILRWLSAGQGTRTRALATSRFPLVDLNDWKNAGHREERLEDLEPAAAREVLRGWGVKGDDATLDGLAAPLHYHALSVAVLGSYLGKLWGGDPSKAPTFDRREEAAADPKAARLSRILTHYAEKLPNAERDLLARLSTFPRGVTVEFLGFLIDAGGPIAGALAGCSEVRLLRLLEQLRDLGLVFRYDSTQGATFTAHPFLRDYFRDLLGVTKPEEIHEAVRARLAPSLEKRPNLEFVNLAMLDRYEALIEHTCLARRTQEAFSLYMHGLGFYEHLSKSLGENPRGLRILGFFSRDGTVTRLTTDLTASMRWDLATDWGLYAKNLGDLVTARQAFELTLTGEFAKGMMRSIPLENLANVALLAGHFPEAREIAQLASDESGDSLSAAYLARALAALGDVSGARKWFTTAKGTNGSPLSSGPGLWEAEFAFMNGDIEAARLQARTNRELQQQQGNHRLVALCDALLGLLILPEESAEARRLLGNARDFAHRSGEVHVQLRCYQLASEIARTEQSHNLARSETEAGIHLADTCGFGHYGIELRLALTRVHLDAGDPKSALQRAREALDRSVHPECQYAWGEADGLHLCGIAHARLGEIALARQRLTAALARRERLTHPGLAETRAELDRLGRLGSS